MSQRQGGREVVFHRLARAEYLRARRWYVKERGEPLGGRFSSAVDAAVQRIADEPTGWPTFREKFHWVRLRRFPYLLYYHVVDESLTLVLAVAHAGRRPGYWIRRTKK